MRIAAAFVLLMGGISAANAQQARTGTIEGTVREEASGRPVEGAIVSFGEPGGTTRSNAAGHYLLTQVPAVPRDPPPTLGSSTVTVSVRRFGYFDEAREVLVLEGDTAHLDVFVRRDPRHEEYVVPFETISLERTRCYGTCPAYRLVLTSNGHVSFQSLNPGDGTRGQDSVPAGVFQALVRRASDAGFFKLPRDIRSDSAICRDMATDHPTVTVTIATRESEISVADYHGCFERPDHSLNPTLARLRAFEDAIDSALGSSRWVRGVRR